MRRISLGITTLPRSSIRRTIPVAFITYFLLHVPFHISHFCNIWLVCGNAGKIYITVLSCLILPDAFYSEDYFLEVVPKGVAKDKSLQQLLGKLSIKEDELIACGDGMNDIPMLKIAGVAAVMDNAYEEVKKYADYIAPSNDESGVADIIKRFILNA